MILSELFLDKKRNEKLKSQTQKDNMDYMWKEKREENHSSTLEIVSKWLSIDNTW